MIIETIEQLRSLYAKPKPRSLAKEIQSLERHSRHFISLSPFAIVATHGADGSTDASPRGGTPGFVKVLDDRRLLLPDSKGNNRLDGMTNIIETGFIGLIFLIPGVDETLRINGRAQITTDPELLAMFDDHRQAPKTVIDITTEQVFLHCAKALMRSALWSEEFKVARSVLPTTSKMINDQSGASLPEESHEDMVKRYQQDL